jgi:hypothetical protein
MYLPPAAAWTVDGARWPRRVLGGLGLLAALACLDFGHLQGWGGPFFLLLVMLGVCVLAAALGLRRSAAGHLRWDGAQWHWADGQDHAVTQLVCAIDLQRYLLLRIDCEPGTRRWLWLQSPTMDARWLALRRAVVASQRASAQAHGASLPQ